MNNSNVSAEINKVSDLLSENKLRIPNYQRPYCWEEKDVIELLNDILNSFQQGKQSYRIGSVILHKDKEESSDVLNIVDGQQRITTLLLIYKSLNDEKKLLDNLIFDHKTSHNHIITNNSVIKNWIDSNLSDRHDEFLTYIKTHCEFVRIEVEDLSEAFQMFDSQNGTGKELEAYNLLKAYHIRAMEVNRPEERILCDKRWEDSTRYKKNEDSQPKDVLKKIFREQIYRTRIWSKKEDAYRFSKKEIAELKGVTLSDEKSFEHPFQNRQLLENFALQYTQSLGLSLSGIKHRFENKIIENINPFVLINQSIINGKPFFDYVETYLEIYKRLFMFKGDDLCEFKDFYSNNCNNYPGAYRSGDYYLREAYKSLVFLMFDKFGDKGVIIFYKTLYCLIYRLRLEKKQVRYNTVAKDVGKYFAIIEEADNFNDLKKLDILIPKEITMKKEVATVKELLKEKKIKINVQ